MRKKSSGKGGVKGSSPQLRRLVSKDGMHSTIRHVASLGSYEDSDHESFVEEHYELPGLTTIPEWEIGSFVSK